MHRNGSNFGINSTGRVEIYDYENDIWKVLCDENWTRTDADIVCKDLYFEGAVENLRVPDIDSGHLQTLSKNFVCNGTEDYLRNCNIETSRSQNCTRKDVVGVRCKVEGYLN